MAFKFTARNVSEIIVWCWMFLCTHHYPLTWNQSKERWEEFHIRFCGKVCDNGTLVDLYGSSLCPSQECFPCECGPLCPLLDTCCPHRSSFASSTLNARVMEPRQSYSGPPYPEQVKCAPLPFSSWNVLQIVSCPPEFERQKSDVSSTENQSDTIRELCGKNFLVAQDLDSLYVYVDKRNGLVFKNKFCALCNGYTLNVSTEVSGDDDEGHTLSNYPVAQPWPVRVNCSRFQELYAITSETEFLKAAASDFATCSAYYDLKFSNVAPRRCFGNEPENLDALTCGEPMLSLCRDLNHTYLSLNGFKNVFCYMCRGFQPQHYFYCQNSNTFVDSSKRPAESLCSACTPPLSLLLGISKRPAFTETMDQRNCSSSFEWMDEKWGSGGSSGRAVGYHHKRSGVRFLVRAKSDFQNYLKCRMPRTIMTLLLVPRCLD
ncbi:hypothetical protein PoB_006938100 [Plakobranchus ocellatus]|uniref:SMB domain-containing protein n=1 Tax=Plakobranchus ocellatus TaxID=259542 RepID=A0AAV4DFB8_9GAST|nr:hypothetical protein PoB_006938100 [Plakobranchus ocellatus]